MLLQKEEAKALSEELFSLYAKVEVARSAREKGVLKEQIRAVKSKMQARSIGHTPSATAVNRVCAVEDTQREDPHMLCISKKENDALSVDGTYSTAKISSTKDCTVSNLSVDTSCYIDHCTNLTLYVVAQQVRVSNSTNITLFAYTKTGVYIDNSKDVSLLQYTPTPKPEWAHHPQVYNFNEPKVL
ncbi:hypothetical protein NECID01_0231 [Nematocida sp. AWRm77]|nr:hypothetical protein NECID01_0231 [Nematocida sp. AWRm77]